MKMRATIELEFESTGETTEEPSLPLHSSLSPCCSDTPSYNQPPALNFGYPGGAQMGPNYTDQPHRMPR